MTLAGRNGCGHCGDATTPRDSQVGSPNTTIGSAGSTFLALLLHHRIERPPCLENPRSERGGIHASGERCFSTSR
jgi:hypothetical protein